MVAKSIVLLLSVASTAASAQIGPIAVPALRTARPATLTVPLDRKLQILQAAGINAAPGALEESLTLSVRKPWVDEGTYLSVTRPSGYAPEGNVTALQGVTGGLHRSYLTLYWRANAAKRHIVDCAVSNYGREPIAFDWALGTGRSGATAPIVDGRAAIVMPAGSKGDLALTSANGFTFSSCEITPVG